MLNQIKQFNKINKIPKEIYIKDFYFKMDSIVMDKTKGKKGIYLFIQNKKVIYVGKTIDDLFYRIKTYTNLFNKEERDVIEFFRSNGYENVDLILYILDPAIYSIKEIEIYYIKTLDPVLNKHHRVKSTTGKLKPESLKTNDSLFKFRGYHFLILICLVYYIFFL